MRIIILLLLVGTLQAQNYHTFNVPVSVGGATNASSLLTLNSTTQGFLIPRMTTAQRDAIPAPAVGLQIYNTETNTINIYNGTWGELSGGGGGIGGTIAAGQVAFGSATDVLSSSANLRWFNDLQQLRIGTNISGSLSDGFYRLQVSGAISSGQEVAAANVIKVHSVNSFLSSAGLTLRTSSVLDGSSGNFWTTSGNFSIGSTNVSSSRLLTQGSSTANTSLSFLTQNSSATNTFSVGDAGLVTIYKDTESSATQSSARIAVESGDANTNLVLTPKGTGALMVGPAPDGTVTGGNARGASAIDLQRVRTNANQVASGIGAVLAGGYNNRSSETRTVVSGGEGNSAVNGYATISGGFSNNASGSYSVVSGGRANSSQNDYATISGGFGHYIYHSYGTISGGSTNVINASHSNIAGGSNNVTASVYSTITGGRHATTNLEGQRAHATNRFTLNSDAQTSDIRVMRSVTGPFNRVLSLDGADTTKLAVLSTVTTTNGRVWNARLQCVAVTNVQGTGGPAEGSVFSETMDITIKRIGSVTSIVNGTPMQSVSVSDVGMSGADFLVDADDTNESLRVRFQPPTIAAADTQIRAVCTVYLTEIGY